MKVYWRRVFAQLLKLAVLIALLYGAMVVTHTAMAGPKEFFANLFGTTRGMILLVLLVGLALLNPRIGYVTRRAALELPAQREALLAALRACDYSLRSEDGGVLLFRSASIYKRLVHVWDEALEVRQDGAGITVSGPRKEVVRAVQRIEMNIM